MRNFKKNKKLIFLKLGGALITKPKPYTPDLKRIEKITKEIHKLRQKMEFKLLLGNGGGSFPHISAKKYQTHKGIINKESVRGMCIVENDAAKLNRILIKELINAGENAISVQPSAAVIAENGKIKTFYLEPIKNYLKYDLIPVVYGDVVIDLKRGCTILSTEKILSFLANKLKPEKIIMMSNVKGVYDDKKRVIPEINKSNFQKIKKFLKGANKTDVTGGMFHKVEESVEMAKNGFEIYIIEGKEGNLEKCLKGKPIGTKIKQKLDFKLKKS
jgi:isopentenyl phosphate kinase